MDCQIYKGSDIAALVRLRLEVCFTGHDFSVRTKGNEIEVCWSDGPSYSEVKTMLEAYNSISWRQSVAVFPDGTISSTFTRLSEEVYIPTTFYFSGVRILHDITPVLIAKISNGFNNEFGFTVNLGVPRRNFEYYLRNPKSFTDSLGEEYEAWGDKRAEYNRTREKWVDYIWRYSDYDMSRSALNFLIPAARYWTLFGVV